MKNYRGKIHTYIMPAISAPAPPVSVCFSWQRVFVQWVVAVGLMFVLLSGKEGWGRVFRVLISYNYYELNHLV